MIGPMRIGSFFLHHTKGDRYGVFYALEIGYDLTNAIKGEVNCGLEGIE